MRAFGPVPYVRHSDELFDHYSYTLEAFGNEKRTLALIFNKAQNKFQDPTKLRRAIVDLINEEDWSSMSADVKGDVCDGGLQKYLQALRHGALQRAFGG